MAQGKKISTPTITVKSATTGQNVTVATTGKYAETVVIDNRSSCYF